MSNRYIRLEDVSFHDIHQRDHLQDGDTPGCSSESASPKMAEKYPAQLYLVTIMAAMGGLLFGYDTGVISGALILAKDDLDISDSVPMQSIEVAATPFAAMLFAGVGGVLGNKYGRRITILISSVIFILGTGILVGSVDQWMFLAGRFIVGAGVGLASMVVPLYLAECAPESIRGALVTVFQMMITLGILISNILDASFTNTNQGWRYAFGIGAAPAVVMFFGLLKSPESPRYLVMKGNVDDARKCLNRIRSKDHNVEGEIQDIINVLKEEEKLSESVRGNIFSEMMKSDHARRALTLGCMLQFFQQFSGINTVMYYGGTILRMSGISEDKATGLWYSCIIFATNFVMSFNGIWLIERVGRRILTIGSLVGITITMIVLGVAFQLSRDNSDEIKVFESNATVTTHCGNIYPVGEFCTSCTDDPDCGFCFSSGDFVNGSCVNVDPDDHDFAAYGRCSKGNIDNDSSLIFLWDFCMAKTTYTVIIVIALILYLVSFSSGFACTAWTVNAEIYPLWARSTGVSIATAVNWLINVIVSVSFLFMKRPTNQGGLGPDGSFYFFGAISVVGLLCVVLLMPETKGKSMEEMEELFSIPLYKRQPKNK